MSTEVQAAEKTTQDIFDVDQTFHDLSLPFQEHHLEKCINVVTEAPNYNPVSLFESPIWETLWAWRHNRKLKRALRRHKRDPRFAAGQVFLRAVRKHAEDTEMLRRFVSKTRHSPTWKHAKKLAEVERNRLLELKNRYLIELKKWEKETERVRSLNAIREFLDNIESRDELHLELIELDNVGSSDPALFIGGVLETQQVIDT